MHSSQQKKIQHLIVDSGGFIRNAPLGSLSGGVISLYEVVDEIKDKSTKERLQVLPYELQFKSPSTEAIAKVTEFSKKTGDFPALSATDIKVIALTYDFHVLYVGKESLRDSPIVNKTVNFYKPGDDSYSKSKIAGFYAGEEEEKPSESVEEIEEGLIKASIDTDNKSSPSNEDDDSNSKEESDSDVTQETIEEEIEVDSDDEGWTTPGNLKEKNKMMLGDQGEQAQNIVVAIMTTDFAMQNVSKQLGLSVVSVDGYEIRKTKTWILRCYACFHTTSLMHKKFCSNCGNKTLKRVSVSLNEDGSQQIHISTRVRLTGRGKKFSLPKPQGGKHTVNPILSEDQCLPQQRQTRLARQKTDALSDDYLAGSSPFILRDINSKSAIVGTPGVGTMNNVYWMKKNPNEVGHGTGNRRKKKNRN
uniref:RNA-binding protein NOB1 n=1 Tax=Caligus clemensi TaxID=344056 RepID=C1C2G7_CALCM|nr:RNA-binding protein NOB1 [Caligus clemensi]